MRVYLLYLIYCARKLLYEILLCEILFSEICLRDFHRELFGSLQLKGRYIVDRVAADGAVDAARPTRSSVHSWSGIFSATGDQKKSLLAILYWNSLPLRQQLRFEFPLMYGISNVPLPCTSSTARGRRVVLIVAIKHQIGRDGRRRGRRRGRCRGRRAVDDAADYERINAFFV